MITAMQAKLMTREAIEKEHAYKKLLAETFCEQLEKQIVEQTEKGLSFLTVNVEENIVPYVIQILKSNDYRIEHKNHTEVTLFW